LPAQIAPRYSLAAHPAQTAFLFFQQPDARANVARLAQRQIFFFKKLNQLFFPDEQFTALRSMKKTASFAQTALFSAPCYSAKKFFFDYKPGKTHTRPARGKTSGRKKTGYKSFFQKLKI
jgi:hypothetical protein